MNIEEAIGRLKNIAKNAVEYDYLSWEEIEAIKVLLTAYEKEKERTHHIFSMGGCDYISIFEVNDNYIHKDKIKVKIEELKEDEDFYTEQDRMYEYEGKIKILQSLLEEKE